ncbi:hypothetical protein, partial [Myroides albus]|uniref:hypothetical protein n=1 Tax=Myroides albus TaxID=2562892 RepID=UPI001E4195BD
SWLSRVRASSSAQKELKYIYLSSFFALCRPEIGYLGSVSKVGDYAKSLVNLNRKNFSPFTESRAKVGSMTKVEWLNFNFNE